jgi:regulator of RNase E activity RraA
MGSTFTGKIGFCIGGDIARPDPAVFATLREFGTPAISDGLNKFNTMDHQIKPISNGVRIAGPAITVRLRPGDNLMLHKAIGLAQPGDIIVVDTCGCKDYCVMGDLMASAAFKKGIGGFVIDGAIRDVVELREKRFPIFAKYVVPAVGDKDGPGEINLPISCGGVPVLPGDYIVGDDCGVVVVPPSLVTEIIEGTRKKLAYEAKRALEIEAGVIQKPDIDEKLRKLGIID